jgi:hypothetical protein
LETADRQEPTEALATKSAHLKEKLAKLKEEMGKLEAHERRMLASPDAQISLTDPDSRSMATSGRGSGVVGYNVQVAVDTTHHLIVTHEVTNSGSDRSQLAGMANKAKEVFGVEELEAIADRGYYNGEEIIACAKAGITVTLPKPMTSASRILPTSPTRMLTAALLARSSPIATATSRTASRCGAIGRMHAAAAC